MQLKIKKLHPDAIIPQYQTDGAACFDLHALKSELVWVDDAVTFETGIAFEVPTGWALMVYSRSGHGFHHGVRLANCVGVVDSDFRGAVNVCIRNDGPFDFKIKAGDRIAQAMLVQVPRVELVEADDLSETARGNAGFGSTGA